MSLFCSHHYKLFADEIKTGELGRQNADYFVDLFSKDNINFDADRFWRAAGLSVHYSIFRPPFDRPASGIFVSRHPGIHVAYLQDMDEDLVRAFLTRSELIDLKYYRTVRVYPDETRYRVMSCMWSLRKATPHNECPDSSRLKAEYTNDEKTDNCT